MRLHALLWLFCLVPALSAQAEAPPPADPAALLETVVVSGEQPGPGLWKVSKGDHVLWILGTLTPLPKKMEWVSREVEDVISRAGQVLLAPQASLKVRGGMFTGMFLLPSLFKARNNPDKQTLQQVLPADLYARWQPLREKYVRDNDVEKRRPIFAALELYEQAIKRSGLRQNGQIGEAVEKLAKKHRIVTTRPVVEVQLAEPRQALKDFARSQVDDIDCLRKTVTRLEADLPAMRARANAWATGDIDGLRALPYVDQNQACRDALLHNSTVQQRGLGDLRQRVAKAWLEAAEAALAQHAVSLAVLPMGEVLNDDGYIATLRARGYQVEAPL
jgi:uncharacterized protein YbaP (TraB family)